MPPFQRLPTLDTNRNALIDFSPLNQSFADVRQQAESDRQYGLQQDQMRMQRERFGMEKQRFAADRENEIKRRIGGLALLYDPAKDPDGTKWKSVLGLHPEAAKLDPRYHDAATGRLAILADAGMAGDYLTYQMKQQEAARASAAERRAGELHTAQMGQFKLASPEARAEAAAKYGIAQGSPEYQAFVLQGTLPTSRGMSPTVQKEILEADQLVRDSRAAMASLEQAVRMSKEAYSGAGAGTFGSLVDGVVPWPTPAATKTVELQQIITQQALQQLKAIFGAAPTEGERKILLDIQGSVNQSAAAREAIWNRAMEMARQRMVMAQQTAEGLRGGGYFKPGGAPQAAAPSSAGSGSGSAAADPLGIR